jgi:hydroxyacylglutathione hydrolase
MPWKIFEIFVTSAMVLLDSPALLALGASLSALGVWCWSVGPSKALFFVGYQLFNTRLGSLLWRRELEQHRKSGGRDHSAVEPTDLGAATVLPVPMGSDNYAYLVIDHATAEVAAVDPADADAVQWALRAMRQTCPGLAERCGGRAPRLTTVLTTHRHWDHAGGNAALLTRFPKITVVGGADEGCPGATRGVIDGEVLRLGATEVTVLSTPCHTSGHVAYLVHAGDAADAGGAPQKTKQSLAARAALFSGDCVFVGGCGKFFEGGAGHMLSAVRRIDRAVRSRAKGTLLFPGHEYTVANLEYAAWLEPSNGDTRAKLDWALARRAEDPARATVPSSWAEERRHNPFLRCGQKALQQRCELLAREHGLDCPSDARCDVEMRTMAWVRAMKDAGLHKPRR